MIKILKKHRSKQSESKEQSLLIKYCNSIVELDSRFGLIFAIPNQSYGGTKKDMLRGMKFKREGRKSGVPDLFLPVANADHNGLFIEMKTGYNQLSDNQIQWFKDLYMNNFDAVVAYSAWDAFEYINEYLNTKYQIPFEDMY